jgi:hypothetical protein
MSSSESLSPPLRKVSHPLQILTHYLNWVNLLLLGYLPHVGLNSICMCVVARCCQLFLFPWVSASKNLLNQFPRRALEFKIVSFKNISDEQSKIWNDCPKMTTINYYSVSLPFGCIAAHMLSWMRTQACSSGQVCQSLSPRNLLYSYTIGNIGIDSGQDVAEHLAAAKCYWWSALGYRAECFTHASHTPRIPHTCPISVRLGTRSSVPSAPVRRGYAGDFPGTLNLLYLGYLYLVDIAFFVQAGPRLRSIAQIGWS